MARKSPSSIEQAVLATLLYIHEVDDWVNAKQVREAGRSVDKLSTLASGDRYPQWWNNTYILYTAPRNMLNWERRGGVMFYKLSDKGQAWLEKQGLANLAALAGIKVVAGVDNEATMLLLRKLFENSVDNADGTVTFTVDSETADTLYSMVG